jgi:hypothetical protein
MVIVCDSIHMICSTFYSSISPSIQLSIHPLIQVSLMTAYINNIVLIDCYIHTHQYNFYITTYICMLFLLLLLHYSHKRNKYTTLTLVLIVSNNSFISDLIVIILFWTISILLLLLKPFSFVFTTWFVL